MFQKIFNTIISSKKRNDEYEDNPNHVDIYSPVKGKYIELIHVEDRTFSSGILGIGFAVEPRDYSIYSPIDGKVTMLFPTLHAIGITHENGLELLIHVGIDTVNLKGKHFKSYVSEGIKVKKGDLLLKFDGNKILELGYKLTTPTIITNSKMFKVKLLKNVIDISNDTLIIETDRVDLELI